MPTKALLIDIDETKSYVFELSQSPEGYRYITRLELSESPEKHAVFRTVEITGSELANWNPLELHKLFRLADGRRILLGGHGEWYTPEEGEYLERLSRDGAEAAGSPPWVNGMPPIPARRAGMPLLSPPRMRKP
jgi:hypothetical protein